MPVLPYSKKIASAGPLRGMKPMTVVGKMSTTRISFRSFVSISRCTTAKICSLARGACHEPSRPTDVSVQAFSDHTQGTVGPSFCHNSSYRLARLGWTWLGLAGTIRHEVKVVVTKGEE